MMMKQKIVKEHTDRFKAVAPYLPLLYILYLTNNTGFKIKSKVLIFLQKFSLSIITSVCGALISWKALYITEVIRVPLTLIAIMITLFSVSIFLYVGVIKKNALIKLFHFCVDIDILIGAKETKFMRAIDHRGFTFYVIVITIIAAITATSLVITTNSSISTIIIGTLLVINMYCSYIFLDILLAVYLFISLRVRYLNIALTKESNVNYELFAQNVLFFDGFFWKKAFNDLVKIHRIPDKLKVKQVFRLIFIIIRHIETSYRFVILIGTCFVLTSSIVTAHGIINYLKIIEVIDEIRISVILNSVGLLWFFKFVCGIFVDMFLKQISKTQQICVYVMLESNLSEDTLQLTEDIFQMLKVHDPQISVYGMFYFNFNAVMKCAVTIIVLIVQLFQFSFPTREDLFHNNVETYANVTDHL